MMHLLIGARGDYEDRWEYPIFAYTNEDQAKEERDLLNNILKTFKQLSWDMAPDWYSYKEDYESESFDLYDACLETTLEELIEEYNLPEALHQEALSMCIDEQRLYSIDHVRLRGDY